MQTCICFVSIIIGRNKKELESKFPKRIFIAIINAVQAWFGQFRFRLNFKKSLYLFVLFVYIIQRELLRIKIRDYVTMLTFSFSFFRLWVWVPRRGPCLPSKVYTTLLSNGRLVALVLSLPLMERGRIRWADLKNTSSPALISIKFKERAVHLGHRAQSLTIRHKCTRIYCVILHRNVM